MSGSNLLKLLASALLSPHYSLDNSADFFDRSEDTLECDNSTFHPFRLMWDCDKTGPKSAVRMTCGSREKVELMFMYCSGGCKGCCRLSAIQRYRIDSFPLLCENLVRLRESVPLKVRDCKCATHAAVQIARAVVGMHV